MQGDLSGRSRTPPRQAESQPYGIVVPMMQGPGVDENPFWAFREKGYVAYTKTEKHPYELKSVLEHFLGISILFKNDKVSDIEWMIGITLGRQ